MKLPGSPNIAASSHLFGVAIAQHFFSIIRLADAQDILRWYFSLSTASAKK